VRDNKGNLYGTTYLGGPGIFAYIRGVIFKLDATGKEAVLLTFPRRDANPSAGLVLTADGTLYGSTSAGGANDAGVVWKLDSTGYTDLYSFPGNGNQIDSGVTLDKAGNIYGTTSIGRVSGPELGQVYKVSAAFNPRERANL
jgi:uncharacterized repeat protein (TIGR03803 family)